MYYIFGLGNPESKYKFSRHNIGHLVLDWLHENHNFEEWQENKKFSAIVSKGKIFNKDVTLIMSTENMNNSGKTIKKFVKNASQAKKLIVIQDDIDMGLGDVKILFNRGTGGHKGIESINRSIKTKSYFRIKIGISKKTKSGKISKPKGYKEVVDFVLGNFTKKEKDILNNTYKLAEKAINSIFDTKLTAKNKSLSQVIR